MASLEGLTDDELIEKINSMTHQIHQSQTYAMQSIFYHDIVPYWDEYHRRNP